MQNPEPQAAEEAASSVGSWALVAATAVVTVTSLGFLAALGTPPGADYSAERTVSWFHDHREDVRWAIWFLTVGAPPSAIMFALLRRLLPAPHRDIFLIGVLGYIVLLAAQSWFWGGLALHADHSSLSQLAPP